MTIGVVSRGNVSVDKLLASLTDKMRQSSSHSEPSVNLW